MKNILSHFIIAVWLSATAFAQPMPLAPATQAKIAAMKPIFDGRTLDGWIQSPLTSSGSNPSASWVVKDGAMASTGGGRGVIYTKDDYSHYRLVFTMRHVSGKPDHQPCVLVFCTRPPAGERGLDALAGIQFQTPNGGHWDYRPGHNNAGTAYFVRPVRTTYDNHEWHQVEILVNAKTGVARMAVAQPIGTRAIENCIFTDPAAGKTGPLAWQMHNAGLFDEFKDVRIEIDPKEDRLITVE